MGRDKETRSDLIDLGSASIETKGAIGHVPDLALGQTGTALSND